MTVIGKGGSHGGEVGELIGTVAGEGESSGERGIICGSSQVGDGGAGSSAGDSIAGLDRGERRSLSSTSKSRS